MASLSIPGTIELQMDEYLCQFVRGALGGADPLHLKKDHWFGQLVYDNLSSVPEDCRFIPHVLPGKGLLKIAVCTLGGRDAVRKNGLTHYYLPRSRQVFIERYVRGYFDNVLCSFLNLAVYKQELEIKALLEIFCRYYGIDFCRYYDTFKKKFYRARLTMKKNIIHTCPSN